VRRPHDAGARPPRVPHPPPAPEASSSGAGERVAPSDLVVGRILAPWGYRGEVKVEILTDFPERFSRLREILVGDERRPYRVQAARLHKGAILLKLGGIDTPEQADALRGEILYVPLSEAMPLGKGEYYHHQILGLTVWTVEGENLGRISEILETGSNDVYVVTGEGREVLVPALKSVIREVDLEHGRMTVALPPGLLD